MEILDSVANIALQRMLRDGIVDERDVREALIDEREEASSKLALLGSYVGRPYRVTPKKPTAAGASSPAMPKGTVAKVITANATTAKPKIAPLTVSKPVSALTKKQKASRKLQGEYLGLLKQVGKDARPQYQKIAKEHGRELAIAKLRSVLGKS